MVSKALHAVFGWYAMEFFEYTLAEFFETPCAVLEGTYIPLP